MKQGQRVLMHLLNASAVENRTIALPGPSISCAGAGWQSGPGSAKVAWNLTLAPGERIDAIVEMNQPGVWILGATDDATRQGGLGVVLEYASQHRPPQWVAQSGTAGTTPCSAIAPPEPPDQTIEMVFEKIPGGAGQFNLSVNGKPYPHEREFVLQAGTSLSAAVPQPHR